MMMKQYLDSEATGTGQTTLHQFTLSGITGNWSREELISV
jgi:hypothetical protein